MPVQKNIDDALLYSKILQAQASSEGFDWPHITGVLDKVDEEATEIRSALSVGDMEHARQELGDLLLITVNLSRFLEADPREELLRATERFSNRFEFLKRSLAQDGKTIQNSPPEEVELRWQHIKHDADKLLSNRA